MTQDPYPTDLDEMEFAPPSIPPADPIVVALNRIAVAIERNTAALQNGTRPTQTALAPLPPVQPVTVVPGAPPCPFHGPDKVAPSRKGGFYCQAKARPGEAANPKGYCVWHT